MKVRVKVAADGRRSEARQDAVIAKARVTMKSKTREAESGIQDAAGFRTLTFTITLTFTWAPPAPRSQMVPE